MKVTRREDRATGEGPLRVAVVSDGVYPYFKGGKELRAFQLFSRMPSAGMSVQFFTMQWWGTGKTSTDHGVEMRALCRARPMYKGSRRSIVQALTFAASCLRLWGVQADVIDADHMPYLPLLPVLAISRARRIPVVVTWHEWWGKPYWCQYLGPLGAPAAWLESWLARRAPQIVVHTSATARQLRDVGVDDERITVVSNGVDLALVGSAPPSTAHFDLLYVGRLIAHKGAHLLVEAVAALRERGLELTCGIVGEGPESERLEALVRARGLATQVKLLGRVEDESEVFGLMKSARTFVLPTVREGYGLAVAEALACGAQVVTTNHPDNNARQLVIEGQNGWLCDPDAMALANALQHAHQCPLDSGAVAATGRALGWDQAAASLAGVYRQSIGRTR